MAKLGTSYGIGISNAFDLLQDENEELEAKKAAARPVTQRKPASTEVKGEGRSEGGGRGRGSRGRGRRFLPGEGGPAEPMNEKPSDRPTERGDRRRGREGMNVRPGTRVYDRKSGTGRGKEVQKGGAGRGNWGNNNDEIVEGEEKLKDEEPLSTEGEAKEGEEKTEEKEERVPEPEENFKTLAEYLEEKKKKQETLSSLPPSRKPGEGEDPSKWKDYVPMKKANAVVEQSPKEEKKEKKEKEAKEPKTEAVSADLLGFRAPPRPRGEGRGRGGRGGRGGGEGRGRGRKFDQEDRPHKPSGGRGASKGAAETGAPIKVDNEHFPTLNKATKA